LPSGAGSVTWSASVEVSGGPLTYAEAEGALSSDGDQHLVTAYMPIPDAGGSDAGSPFNWLGISTSSNDGTTFTAQTPIISATDYQLYDPSLVNDGMGNTYLAYAGLDLAGTGGELYVLTSTNNGSSWGSSVNALPTGFDPIDKPFMVLSPVNELPAIVFADISGSFGASSRISMVTSPTADQFVNPVALDDGDVAAFRDLATLAFDGNDYGYAAWIEVQSAGQSTSIEDQATGTTIAGSGANFVRFTAFPVSATGIGTHTPNTQVSANGEAVVVDAVRLAVAPDSSEIYAAYVVASASNVTDIRVAASSNQGMTWGTPVTVDDDPGCATHFHPAIFLDSSGTVWVSWVDNRDGNGHVFYASSTDNGMTFSANAVLSDTPFNFTTLINSAQADVPGWLGGYQFLGGNSTELYSLWTADIGSNGASNPAHLYFSKAQLH
jgi:hypothetical protein